jgi:hypothetical protein
MLGPMLIGHSSQPGPASQKAVSDREKVGDNDAAANHDLRPCGIADLKSLVFKLKERRPFGVCRSDDGQHEPGSANRVQGLDQIGTSVQ